MRSPSQCSDTRGAVQQDHIDAIRLHCFVSVMTEAIEIRCDTNAARRDLLSFLMLGGCMLGAMGGLAIGNAALVVVALLAGGTSSWLMGQASDEAQRPLLRITNATVVTHGETIALDTVQRVDSSWGVWLRLHTAERMHRVYLPRPAALPPVVALLEENVARRRAALRAEGHDVDRAVSVPEALSALQQGLARTDR